MRAANLAQVKNQLSRFVAMARRGTRVRILVRGVPAADLVPVETGPTPESEEHDLGELERLGLVRRGGKLGPGDEKELGRPGPRVRGGRAAEAVLAERRSGR
jgi:antitoxin (DNA-binding transcriptional repressor) of toxin-antitoxin stability system